MYKSLSLCLRDKFQSPVTFKMDFSIQSGIPRGT